MLVFHFVSFHCFPLPSSFTVGEKCRQRLMSGCWREQWRWETADRVSMPWTRRQPGQWENVPCICDKIWLILNIAANSIFLSPLLQYFEYSTRHEIRHNIQKELCLHGTERTVKLEDCQYKGRNTFVGAEQKWELKDVSLFFLRTYIYDFQYSSYLFNKVLFSLRIESVTSHPRMEHVSECPSWASLSGPLQPLRQIPTLVLHLSV